MNQALKIELAPEQLLELAKQTVALLADEMQKRKLLNEQKQNAWIGREEIAKQLGIGTATIDRYVKQERIPSRKIGRNRQFQLAEVEKALRDTSAKTDS